LKSKIFALACVFSATAAAQLGDYLGPGILTRGAGGIGTRSGEQVSLRLFAGVNAIYDNGLNPLSVDSKGNLVQVNGLYGVEANVGAYGVHNWREAQLGLDYKGDFRHYDNNSYFDGSDHQLRLGLTYQKSKRLYFDVQELAGTYSTGVGSIPGVTVPIPSVVGQGSSLLFDNRTYFNETSVNATYLLTSRTSFTAGGEEFFARYRSASLIGMNGYSLNGSLQHRLSRNSTVGASYSHQHFDYPGAFGQSDIDTIEGFFSTKLGRRWTISLHAGGYQAQVQGIQSVALDPTIAAILGISSFPQTFYKLGRFPTGSAVLSRQFKESNLSITYHRSVLPGNGVYLTSRNEDGYITYSYTGVRKSSFSISGGENSLTSVGQGLQMYRSYNGGAGFTYALTGALHLAARYDVRRESIQIANFRQTADRATIGITFSPGKVPLSLW
jgi:hypothetical protein